jgi:GGDEF domain-containing protein
LTISVGLVVADASSGVEKLLTLADSAMYDAKRAGGNQFCER